MKNRFTDRERAALVIARRALKRVGYTNRETARILRVPWQTVYRWERELGPLSSMMKKMRRQYLRLRSLSDSKKK
jgi:transposase